MKKSLLICFLLVSAASLAQDKPLEPTQTEAALTVFVTDLKNKPREGEHITFTSLKTQKEYSGVTKKDGKFYILIPKGETYKVGYKAFSDTMQYAELPIPLAKDTLLSFEFQLKYDLPKTYTLDNVYFDTGKSTLRPESYKELNELAEFLLARKNMVIEIAGHTDNVGQKDANLKLSQERANAVRNYLIKKGVNPDNVVAKGYGDSQPIALNDTDGGKQKNRRTEVRIIKENQAP
ncbi:MAG: OmpA family protein [Bacteroidota bacterium]